MHDIYSHTDMDNIILDHYQHFRETSQHYYLNQLHSITDKHYCFHNCNMLDISKIDWHLTAIVYHNSTLIYVVNGVIDCDYNIFSSVASKSVKLCFISWRMASAIGVYNLVSCFRGNIWKYVISYNKVQQ